MAKICVARPILMTIRSLCAWEKHLRFSTLFHHGSMFVKFWRTLTYFRITDFFPVWLDPNSKFISFFWYFHLCCWFVLFFSVVVFLLKFLMVSFDVLCLWVEVFEEEGEGRLYVRKRKYKEKEVGAICETSIREGGETVIVWSSFFYSFWLHGNISSSGSRNNIFDDSDCSSDYGFEWRTVLLSGSKNKWYLTLSVLENSVSL